MEGDFIVSVVRGSQGAGRRYLLTCAMTHYQHCAEWNREELSEDVRRVVQLLCGEFLRAEDRYEHIDVLGDSPTSVELLDRLREFCVSSKRHADDYLVLYLAGHGEVLDDGDFVVLASDAQPSDLLHRTVPTSEIVKRALAGTGVRRLLILLDTCYSGRGGEDLVAEALRRIDQPGLSGEETGGRGVVLVATSHPNEQALPGAFTTCLDRAARSLATAGYAPPTLRVGALINAIKGDSHKPASQSPVWHQLGMDADEPAFVPNPRYRELLVDVDLLEQERLRYTGQLRERFLPVTRWFTGRHQALRDLAAWLQASDTGSLPCVVTGNAGSGKTALLGLIAALSDPDYAPSVSRQGLPHGFIVPDSAIATAIYAGTLTIEQVRDRIAAAAGLLVETVQQLFEGLNQHVVATPIVVLVDALDEAADPTGLITHLLNPLIKYCSGSIRLLLGTRPHLLTTNRLGKPDSGRYKLIDLDIPTYADPVSIRDYARRILLSEDSLDSAYTPSGIYRTAPAAAVDGVTAALGEAAGKSFLVARITATTEATATTLPDSADSAWRASLPRRAGDAMRRDLQVRLGENAARAAHLLLPLAYAQGSGMPWEDIWPRLADVLSPGHGYGNDDLVWLRTAAGSYAVEGVADGRSVYRLYHQALVEHLIEGRDQVADQRVITDTLLTLVPVRTAGHRNWAAAHPYTLAHLATHAARARHLDSLLAEPGFFLASSRSQLLASLEAADSPSARVAADIYRRFAVHLRSKPKREHPSYLQLVARCSRASVLADALDADHWPSSWSARWASWRYPQPPHLIIIGHTGSVRAVAVAELDGRPVVISGGNDATVRVRDLATGASVGKPFTGDIGSVTAVAVAQLDGRPVVITGGDDGTVQVWELTTGMARQLATSTLIGEPFTSHTGSVTAVGVAELDGRPVVISGGNDAKVRIWDLATDAAVGQPFTGHARSVNAIAVTELDGRPVAITGGHDGAVQIWELATGALIGEPFTSHTGWVTAVGVAELDGRPMAISGSRDATVRVWELGTGASVSQTFTDHARSVNAVAVAEFYGRSVVISGSDDATVQVWELTTGTLVDIPLPSHSEPVNAVAVAELYGRSVVISGSDDGTVQVWELATGTLIGKLFPGGYGAPVNSVAVAELDGRLMVISGSRDATVRVWELATGTLVNGPLVGHTAPVNAVAVAELDGRPVVISGSDDATVRLWDLAKGRPIRRIQRAIRLRHSAPVLTVVVQRRRNLVYVSTGCRDGTKWTWDLSTGRTISETPASHGAPVNSIALLGEDGVAFSAGSALIIDRPNQTSNAVKTIELESEVLALATDGRSTVVVGSRLGLVVLDAGERRSRSVDPRHPG